MTLLWMGDRLFVLLVPRKYVKTFHVTFLTLRLLAMYVSKWRMVDDSASGEKIFSSVNRKSWDTIWSSLLSQILPVWLEVALSHNSLSFTCEVISRSASEKTFV